MFNWNLYPFTKSDSVNLDWIFSTLKKLVAGQKSMDESVARAEQAAADAEAAAGSIEGAVVYAEAQELTAAEQEQARENIGAASAADITPDAVLYEHVQTLTNTQRAQARENIGAASTADATGTVKYTAQSLTPTQMSQARANIGAAASSQSINAVLYDHVQQLSDSEKATARDNISAAAADDIPATPVLYGEVQTLDTAQKQQARDNIGAVAMNDIPTTPVLYGEAQSLTVGQQQQARENIAAEELLVSSDEERGGLGSPSSTSVTLFSNGIYLRKFSNRFLAIKSKFISSSSENTAYTCPVLDADGNQVFVKNNTGGPITVGTVGIRFNTTVSSGESYSFSNSAVTQFALNDAYYIINTDGALTVHSYANTTGYGYNWLPEIILEM